MNAMAAQRPAAAAPDIVVVNDGAAVENVASKNKWATLGKWAGICGAALFVGVAVGQMGTNAKLYNDAIDDAELVASTVKEVDGKLQNLRNVLYTARERGPGGKTYLVGDPELTKELQGLDLKMPDLAKVYESRLYELEQGLVDQTITFLTESQILFKEIEEHVARAERDGRALAAGEKRVGKYGNPTRYGIYIEKNKGDGAPVMAQFVELGDPLCADGKPNPSGCDGPPRGFLYRPNEQGPWGPMELASADGVTARTLIPLGFSPSPALNALFKGGEATVAETAYMDRMRELDAKVDDLLDRAKVIRKSLTNTANQSKSFTFFM